MGEFGIGATCPSPTPLPAAHLLFHTFYSICYIKNLHIVKTVNKSHRGKFCSVVKMEVNEEFQCKL